MAKNSFNYEKKGDIFLIHINPKLYALDVIYSAAYVFLDRAYVVLDGDLNKEIIVKIKAKPNLNGEKIALEFNNELIKYCDYKKNLENNKELRQIILQRALFTNDPDAFTDNNNCDIQESTETEESAAEIPNLDDEDFLDDPEGIAIPWEEKYGNDKKTTKKQSKKDNTTKKEKISNKKITTKDSPIANNIIELEDEDFLDDPEGIAIPWEEKYKKKSKVKKKQNKNKHKTKPKKR